MYNTPGYIDVTQTSPLRNDQLPIMTSSEVEDNSPTGGRRRRHSPKYPYAIVWTPIPLMTWFLPFLGHMGICTSNGVIRDFAGSYYVSEDNMAFGKPTRYLTLEPDCPPHVWDTAVSDASCTFKTKMHNLCWNNCHSMVALALNNMKYKNKHWNAWKLGFLIFFRAKFVGVTGFLKTFLPFIIVLIIVACAVLFSRMSWLFGSRKKSSPQLVITTSEINDGFVSVETSHRPYEPVLPPYPIIPDQMPSTPYNIIPQPSYERQFTSNKINQGPVNPLESIPFKLSSALSSDSSFSKSDIASIKNQMDSLKYKLNSNHFDYDFKLERSFVQEINSS